MAKSKATTESIELDHEEMDVIFNALETFEKSSARGANTAADMKAEDVAMAYVKFGKWVAELKNKFLHE